MLISNQTPFSPFVFEAESRSQELRTTLILRSDFEITEAGELAPSPEQRGPQLYDRYLDTVGQSSVLFESDVVPLKVATDIHVIAASRPPTGRPERSWAASFAVEERALGLRISGPRRWLRERAGWRLSEPEPTEEVALVYENAAGGVCPAEGCAELRHENPIGRGFVCAEHERELEGPLPAHQIDFLDLDLLDLDLLNNESALLGPRSVEVAGLSPVAKHWLPRRGRAGTYDRRWREERWPSLPEDFDYAFFNSAHPRLLHEGFLGRGFLRGDERLHLSHLSPSRPELSFSLPGLDSLASATLRSKRRVEARLSLDTLRIDAIGLTCQITWRAIFPHKVNELRSIEIVQEGL